MKKNPTILKNLILWASAVVGTERDGVHKIPKLPILVIDDECDYASVNTKKTLYEFESESGVENEPTVINGLIRQLLHMFDQSAYVGYTATPFANIFIFHSPGKVGGKFGEDLFPRSFIICLARSSDYMGADRVFGLDDSALQGIKKTEGLDILRCGSMDDLEDWIPPNHDKYWSPPLPRENLPASLNEAMLAFVLVCAARCARGQSREHNSMLLHLTRFQDVQKELFYVIEDRLKVIKRALKAHTETDPRDIVIELKNLWESDFLETTAAFDNPNLHAIPWRQIKEHLLPAVEKIKVKVINGLAKDALDYYENREQGVSVITIGGAKLSRGLTLEGLSVSYFQRSTMMYDTLMQMGRWFGYRPGYEDLCRLYITKEMSFLYREIAMATEELYNQFEEMRIEGRTPKEFGLRVAQSPENLLVTARVKMRSTTKVKLSYAGANPSYRSLKITSVEKSIEATKKLVQWASSVSKPDSTSAAPVHLYREMPVDGVVSFLKDFPAYPGITTADPRLLTEYIEACNVVGDLTSWSIGIISIAEKSRESIEFEGLSIRLPRRLGRLLGEDRIIGTLWDPPHEKLGLSNAELAEAQKTPREKQKGVYWRHRRNPEHGLLAIYLLDPEGLNGDNKDHSSIGEFGRFPCIPTFAMSFPFSKDAPKIDYRVRNDYWSKVDDDSSEDF